MRKLMLTKAYIHTSKRGDGNHRRPQAFPTRICHMRVLCEEWGRKAEIPALTLPPHFLKVLQGPLVTNLFWHFSCYKSKNTSGEVKCLS